MTLSDSLTADLARFADFHTRTPAQCLALLMFSFAFSVLMIRSIVSGLMQMHRSKSALKKLRKTYSLWQKLYLKHAWDHCLHAAKFCRGLIVAHHCIFCLMLIGLLLIMLGNSFPGLMPITTWYTLALLYGVSLPCALLYFSLDRYPFQKRRHEFRFMKYHNTGDHSSLW